MLQQGSKSKFTAKNRHWARRFALQALYQRELAQSELNAIEAHFLKNDNIAKVDFEYFKDLLYGVPDAAAEMESYLRRYVDRPLADIDPIELTILRIATYELLKRVDVPYRVILNEALELGKTFGATDGYKFVNGILDKIAREIRHAEVMRSHANK